MEVLQQRLVALVAVRAVQTPVDNLGFIKVYRRLSESEALVSTFGPDADLLEQTLVLGSLRLYWKKGEPVSIEPDAQPLLEALRQVTLTDEWLPLKNTFRAVSMVMPIASAKRRFGLLFGLVVGLWVLVALLVLLFRR